ncbi:HD domain-containing protein [Patescibacteria group bacterium]|nr:HD domain-containing protein [Patescibacteria group bacterium]
MGAYQKNITKIEKNQLFWYYVSMQNDANIKIPEEVKSVVAKLIDSGFGAYVVGGCVRDLLLGREPDDWDITTSATPEEIQNVFPDSFYANQFLTVTVKTGSENPSLKEIEVTTYRSEGRYTDKRHPDEVRPAKTLEEDLARRDFTVNAMALSLSRSVNFEIVDLFGGQKDLEQKIIRAVGNPEERFEEDALRMLRAVRFAGKFGFSVDEKTYVVIQKNAAWLSAISKERVRDEFVKIVSNENAKTTIELLHEAKLLLQMAPELEEGIGIDQRGPHKYTVWEHNLRALDYAVSHGFTLRVRLAALLHDIAKPRVREKRGGIWTFYGHDVVGAKMAYQMLTRLRFSEAESSLVANLVRWHLFNYKLKRDAQYQKDLAAMGEDPSAKDIEDSEEDIEETTDAAIRRLINRVGAEHIQDLVKVRICDRIATGVPKAVPYRLRHFQFRVEKILREHEATNVKMLAVNGEDVMRALAIGPGPRVGNLLNALLEEVLDDPAKNTKEILENRMRELHALSDDELKKLREQSQEKVAGIEEGRIADIKEKYHVK